MKKHLEYKDEKSHKFWQIEQIENVFTVTYGRIGANGQSKTKEFETAEKAIKETEKLIQQKLKKGYVEALESNDEISQSQEDELRQNEPISKIDYYQELLKFDKEYGGETYAEGFPITGNEKGFFESWLDGYIKMLEATLQKDPNASTHEYLYKQYFKKKNYQKAQEHALGLIKHSENFKDDEYDGIAYKFFDKELYDEALPIYLLTIKLEIDDEEKARQSNKIGYIYDEQGKLKEALKYFREAMKLYPRESYQNNVDYVVKKSFKEQKS